MEKRPVETLKKSRKDVRRMTSLGRSQDINFEPLIQMHFSCIIFNFISPNVCLKHYRVRCFIVLGFWRNVLKTSYKGPKVTSGGWCSRDVPRASILNISTKRISVLEKRPKKVLKGWHMQCDIVWTFLGRQYKNFP